MRAIGVFPGSRDLRLIDHPAPGAPGPREVKVRILEVGVCGTDREIASFHYGAPPQGSEYLVLGHESLGEVVEVGAGVERLAEGDLAVVMVRRPCPHDHCLPCREGRQDFCSTGDFTERGIVGAHGFMTEVVVDHEDRVVRVPRALRDVGVLTEPLTIAEKALLQVWDIQERLPWACREARQSGRAPRLRALVLGAGPVGLLGALTLRHHSFDTVVYSLEEPGSPQARLVESIGGRYISARTTRADDLPGTTGQFDMVYEATGAAGVAFEVLRVLGPNAVFVFTGVPGRKSSLEVDTGRILRDLVLRNQVLLGTVNAGRDAYEQAVRDLGAFHARWPDAVEGLITGRHPPERHEELILGEPGGIKQVLAFA